MILQAGPPPLLSFSSSSGSWQTETVWRGRRLCAQQLTERASAAGGGTGKGGKRTRVGEGGNQTKVEGTVQLH